MDGKRSRQRADSQDQPDIGDIRADDVAEAHRAIAFPGREDIEGQFGGAGPRRDDCEADEQNRDAHPPRDRHGSLDQEVSPPKQQYRPYHKHEDRQGGAEHIVQGIDDRLHH